MGKNKFPRRVRLATFVLGLGFMGTRTSPASADQFPALAVIADADPSIRHKVVLCLANKLRVTRTDTTLSIEFDIASLQEVPVTAGKNMVMGIKDELRVYALGSPRPDRAGRFGLSSSVDLCTAKQRARGGSSADILNRNQGGIPVAGRKYIVEMDVTVFETDIPSQHMWRPQDSTKYKELWSRTLKSID
jgi:hypothetical protein